jgi:hypothetical protein
MLRAVLFAACLLAFDQASGSYFDSCEFDAVVVQQGTAGLLNGTVTSEELQVVAIVKITGTADERSRSICQDAVGRLHVLRLRGEDVAAVQEGATLKLRFETSNGLTPDGVEESYSWSLVGPAEVD